MRKHELKTWPEPFAALCFGEKTAEFRRNDRDFRKGDRLVLREWGPWIEDYTGAWLRTTITHVLRSGEFGIPDGYCMLSLGHIVGGYGGIPDATD